MWLRSMRKDSNVHQQNGVRYGGVFHCALSRVRQLKDKIMRRSSPTLIKKMMSVGEVSDYFSINNQTQDRLLFVENNLSVKDDAVKRATSFLRRWQYKQSIVDEYVDILESGSVAGIELERRRIELIKRYYAR